MRSMKSYFALSLIIFAFIFCEHSAAQTPRTLSFDMSRGPSATGTADGSTRARMANATSSNSTSARELEREVFALINIERRKHRLADLEWNERLAELARLH